MGIYDVQQMNVFYTTRKNVAKASFDILYP